MSDRGVRRAVLGALALPFVVALVALGRRHWSPVLDMAMTEFRVRDVGGRHTPLIGLPGRIGRFPDQGSHPGPLSFYLLAPFYRVLGSSAFGMLAGAAIVNAVAIWTAWWVAARRGGRTLALAFAALMALVTAWLGAGVLTQPWNPYLPLASFLLVLITGWAVLDGDHRMVIVQVVAATLCAQTHVPYLSLCVALVALSFGRIGLTMVRERRAGTSIRPPATSAAVATAVGALLWLPVFVDELVHHPGNITMLREHFLSPPEPPQGLAVGARTMLQHLDVLHVVLRLPQRGSWYLDTLDDLAGGSTAVGLVVLLAWIAAALASTRLGDRRIVRLHAVVAVSLGVGALSTARIFGKVWYYLTLWAWVIGLVAVFATVWTAWAARARSATARRWVQRGSVALLAAASLAFTVDAARLDPPEQHLGAVLTELVDPTVDALRDGEGAAVGADGVYPVVWADAYYFGSQGYGLINELEREGLDARAYPTYRVPVTAHRTTTPDQADAEVVLATGVNVDRWRAIDGAVEVTAVDPRSPAELARFDALRTATIDGLAAAGLDDLVPLVDTNLFGLSVDPRLPGELEPGVAEMLVLGQETAVFIAPPGTFDANP